MEQKKESKADNLPIVKQFAFAFAHFDVASIGKLMADKGEFIIQDRDGEDLMVTTKNDYLSWLGSRFEEYREDALAKKKLKFEFDTCAGCSTGCPVLYFEGAIFPRISEDPEEVLMHGLMLDIKQGKINRILFCYNFKYLERYA